MKKEFGDIGIVMDGIANASSGDPKTYQYYKGLQKRRIVINEDVTDDYIDKFVAPLMDMDNDESGEPITIIVNTCGGDVYPGMALCKTIEKLKTPTTLILPAMSASMGALIAMAGHNNPNVKTICYEYSVFLVHDGSYYYEGNASRVKDTLKFQERYEGILKNYILTHSTIPEDVYDNKTREEWWFGAQEALQYGIVDEVI